MPKEIHKIKFTQLGGSFRPLLEIMVFSQDLLKHSTRTFGLLDSGADYIVIPFSLGNAIGLTAPNDTEFQEASGVGGKMSLIKRTVRIFYIGNQNKKAYGFDEVVYWAFPNRQIQDQVTKLSSEMKDFQKFSIQAKENTELKKYLDIQATSKANEIIKLMDNYETTFLLGRPFFQNFDYVQFLQRDKLDESKNAVHFSVKTHRVAAQIDINS